MLADDPSANPPNSPPGRGPGTHYSGTEAERRALSAFIKLLRAAHWASLRAGTRREEAGLTEGQFGVLEALHHLGPLAQRELAEKLLSSTSNLTLVLDNLERAGAIVRRVDPRDRRRRVVSLTAAGRRKIEELLPRHVARIVEVMAALTPAQQERLGDLCRKLGRAARALDDPS